MAYLMLQVKQLTLKLCFKYILGTRELFQIEFPMTLGSEEEEIIKNALEDILQENSDHLKDDINLETSFGTFTSDEGWVAPSLFTFSSV